MSDELDELFGEAGSGPKPRSRLILALLITGLLLTLVGMVFTAAPGGLVVLLAWVLVDKERDRVASGFLPADVGPQVQRLHRAVVAGLITVLVLFFLQGWLFCATGIYEDLWTWMLQWLVGRAEAPAS